MADQDLNINIGARDRGVSATLGRVGKEVEQINKRMEAFNKFTKVAVIGGGVFNALTAGLERYRDLQVEVIKGTIKQSEAFEEMAVAAVKAIPLIGDAFNLGTVIREQLDGTAQARAQAELEKREHDARNAKADAEAAQRKRVDLAVRKAEVANAATRNQSSFDAMPEVEQQKERLHREADKQIRDLENNLLRIVAEGDAAAIERGDAATKAAIEAIEAKLASDVKKIDDASAQALGDMREELIIAQLDADGRELEAARARVVLEAQKKLRETTDPAARQIIDDLATAQIDKLDREFMEAAERANKEKEKKPEKDKERRLAGLVESNYLTGASSSRTDTLVKEAKSQTKAVTDMAAELRELRAEFGDKAWVAVVKNTIRGR